MQSPEIYRISTRLGETEHPSLKEARKYLRVLSEHAELTYPIRLTYPDGSHVSGTLGEMIDPTSEAKLRRERSPYVD